MKTQQEAIDDRADYFDNLNERSPTRPPKPKQERTKMKTQTVKPYGSHYYGTCAHCEQEFETSTTFNAHLPCEVNPTRPPEQPRTRQAEPTWITWRCPVCNWKNQDSPEETSFPLCGGCGKEFHWDEIKT